MSKERVLVVDDDPVVSESLAAFVTREGYRAATALDAVETMEILERGRTRGGSDAFGIVICDLGLPGRSGLELLRDIRSHDPEVAVFVLTGYGSIESAVESLRAGAVDFLTKPARDADLREALERAVSRRESARAASKLARREPRAAAGGIGLVGTHPSMQRIYELIDAVAPSRSTVLMNGESGTGKSRIARAIHDQSRRSGEAFVQLSCGSIPETLLESELFGHVRGAFTGAHADKVGRFLAADKGTIFLDEINSASQAMQLKLLRVLQERRFEPVGSHETIEVDVRVVLASNEPLEQLVADGRFRQDLYYRVNVVRIDVPPLRERTGDILPLAEHFLERFTHEAGSVVVGFTKDASDTLERYPFPGNVRELENVVERAVVVARGQRIGLDDLPSEVRSGEARLGAAGLGGLGSSGLGGGPLGPGAPLGLRGTDAAVWSGEPLADALRAPERHIIEQALKANGWNRQQTAEQLGINRSTLYKKMRALDIEGPEGRLAG